MKPFVRGPRCANTHLSLRVLTTLFPLVLQLHCIEVRALGLGSNSVPGFRPKVLQGTLNNLRWSHICNETFSFLPMGKIYILLFGQNKQNAQNSRATTIPSLLC